MTHQETQEFEQVANGGARLAKGAIVFLALVIAFSLAASGYALYDRFTTADTRRTQLEIAAAQQERFNKRIREVSLDYCLEIEQLKKSSRDRALETYRNLDQTLELLQLEKTPAIVERAKSDRDTALRRFAAEPCPRPQPPRLPEPVHPLPKG